MASKLAFGTCESEHCRVEVDGLGLQSLTIVIFIFCSMVEINCNCISIIFMQYIYVLLW